MIDKTNTPDEVLDLVNENDQVIGEVTKREANQNPSLIHREIAIILFDKDKKMLFQKRSAKKLVNPGIWAVSCAGHVPKGMTPENAAHMELKEELGFDTPLLFIEKNLDHKTSETEFTYWFIGRYQNQTIILEKEEVDETALYSKEELDRIDTSTFHPGALVWAKRLWSGEFDALINQL